MNSYKEDFYLILFPKQEGKGIRKKKCFQNLFLWKKKFYLAFEKRQ